MAQSGYRAKVNKGRPRRSDPHARRRCTWLQPNSEATPSKTQRSGRSTWKRDVEKKSNSDSPREHRTIGERSLSIFLMLTLFYDFHLIIVRTTLIRRLRKTQTTSKKLKQPRRVVNSRETSSIDYTTPDIMQSDMKSNNLYMRKTNARLTNSLTMYEHYILYCTRQCSG